MNKIKNEYKSFLNDLEKNIKNEEDLAYIKKRFCDFFDVILDQIEAIADYKNEQIEEMEKRQIAIEEKIQKMQGILDNIEKDIYLEDGFDFDLARLAVLKEEDDKSNPAYRKMDIMETCDFLRREGYYDAADCLQKKVEWLRA